MKGRKNKSALISSSSRSVWPMHIQQLRSPSFSLVSLSLFPSLPPPILLSLSFFLLFQVDSTSHPP